MHHVSGCGATTVGRCHHPDVLPPFATAHVHALHDGRERRAAGFARATIEVVRHIVGQQGERRVAVAGVEGGV